MSNAPAAFVLPVVALLLILGGLAALTALRAWAGRLSRESRLGLHSPAASASDDSFRVANKVAAPVVAGSAVVAIILAVLVLVLPLPGAATVVISVLGLVAVVILLIAAGVVGERVARTMPVPARRPTPSAACAGCSCGGGSCAGLTRTADVGDCATTTTTTADVV